MEAYSNSFSFVSTAVLLLVQVSGATAAASDCTDFVVSPQPIVFTVHPSSQRGATAQGRDVQLSCAAFAQHCGGLAQTEDRETISSTSTRQKWKEYRICWEFKPLRPISPKVEYCPHSLPIGVIVLNDVLPCNLIFSNLTIRNASASSSSGSYSCFVEDWRMKYSSYPAHVDLQSGIASPVTTVTSSNSTVYLNASDPTGKVPLKCREAPDSTKDHIWYEWYVNGSLTNNNNSTIEADSIQSFVCYTHFGNSLLAAVYRVLPYGCLNPVVDLEYPTVNVKVHNNSHFTAEVKFCWSHPDHLGGLNLSEIGYHVKFEGLPSGNFPLANVLTENSKLCFEEQFTSMEEMTTKINIKVTAVPKKNGLAEPSYSLATQFPKTTLIGWVKLEVKMYCDSNVMRLTVQDPLFNWVEKRKRRYRAVYHCNTTEMDHQRLSTIGDLMVDYALINPFSSNFGDIKIEPFYVYEDGNEIIFSKRTGVPGGIKAVVTGRGGTEYSGEEIRSCALMVYPTLDAYSLFRPHVSAWDYSICNFEDPPKVQFDVDQLSVERNHNVSVNISISETMFWSQEEYFRIAVHHTSLVTGKDYTWTSDVLSKNDKEESFQFSLPQALAGGGQDNQDKVLNFSLTVPPEYHHVVQLGNSTTLTVILETPDGNVDSPQPGPETSNPVATHHVELTSVGAIFLFGIVMVLITSCFLMYLRVKLRKSHKNSLTLKQSLTLDKSQELWDCPPDEDTLTQYNFPELPDDESKKGGYSCTPEKVSPALSQQSDSAFVDYSVSNSLANSFPILSDSEESNNSNNIINHTDSREISGGKPASCAYAQRYPNHNGGSCTASESYITLS